jgi:hypothetical protein
MKSRPGSRGKANLQPCIAEVLRTCVHPSTLILRVEKILEETIEKVRSNAGPSNDLISHEGRNNGLYTTYRLYLSDGEDMIQALIAPHLQPLIKLQETTEGSLIELREYKIRRAARLHGKGEVIFLGINDYVCLSLSRPTTSELHDEVLLNGGGFLLEQDTQQPTLTNFQAQVQVRSSPPAVTAPEVPSSQESDTFETITIDPETVRKRRQALHEISSNTGQKRKRQIEYDTTPIKSRDEQSKVASSQETDSFETAPNNPETVKRRRQARHDMISARGNRQEPEYDNKTSPSRPTEPPPDDMTTSHTVQPPSSPRAHFSTTNASPEITLPFHTLSSLLHPPVALPPKNYSITILAVVSWISPTLVLRPPFPPRRSLKLHDPSITSQQVGVSISVFIDAATFKPRHGTIALFQGVVMQRHRDEVILNAYPGLRGTEWYVDDEKRLRELGHDVRAMRGWWEERKKAREGGSAGVRGVLSVEEKGKVAQ